MKTSVINILSLCRVGSMRISLNGITTTISYIYSFNITLTSMYVVAAKDSSFSNIVHRCIKTPSVTFLEIPVTKMTTNIRYTHLLLYQATCWPVKEFRRYSLSYLCTNYTFFPCNKLTASDVHISGMVRSPYNFGLP